MEFSNVRAIAYCPPTFARVRVNLLQCITRVRLLESPYLFLSKINKLRVSSLLEICLVFNMIDAGRGFMLTKFNADGLNLKKKISSENLLLKAKEKMF